MPSLDTTQTPLQNLFSYIQEMYSNTEPCFDFVNEPNNPKQQELNYWQIGKLQTLAKQCSRKNIDAFALPIGNDNCIEEYLLKVKRMIVPNEPVTPFILADWTIIDRNFTIPALSFKKETELSIPFESSPQRISDFEQYQKQNIQEDTKAVLPESLKDWVSFTDNGTIRKIAFRNIVEQFDANEDRISVRTQFENNFHFYYDTYATPIQINKLFDALHTIHYELKGKDNKRLHLSFGLVNGKIGGEFYRNFLFHVPLKMSLKNQEISIEMDTFSNRIFAEQYFSDLIPTHFKHENSSVIESRKREVLECFDSFNSQNQDFNFNASFIRNEYYEKGMEMLNLFSEKSEVFFDAEKLEFDFQHHRINNQITFSFSPILHSKIVDSQIHISKDARNIVQKINELQLQNQLDLIPDFFKKLFTIESLNSGVASFMQHQPNAENESSSGTQSKENSHRFLFPLPYNDQQFEIAKRLEEQDAVTVKGPPGTGKSHTIANLIAHFVAQGKSILVVSHNAKALDVLKEKLPKEIQDLAVSLVGASKGNEALKASVNAIIRNLSGRYEANEVANFENDLKQLEEKLATQLEKIYTTILENDQNLSLYYPSEKKEITKSAYDWAVLYFGLDNKEPQIVKDTIDYTQDTKNLPEQLNQLALLGNDLNSEDHDLVEYSFLNDEHFLDLNSLNEYELTIQKVTKIIDPNDYDQLATVVLDEALETQLIAFEKNHTLYEQNKVAQILLQHVQFDADSLESLLSSNQILRNHIKAAEEKLLDFQIELGVLESIDPDILHQGINQLIAKFDNNTTLGWLSKKVLDKQLKPFFNCKVNFIEANEVEHFKAIEIELGKRKSIKQLTITFNNFLKKFDLPAQEHIHETLSILDFVVHYINSLRTLNLMLTQKGLPLIDSTKEQFQHELQFLKNLKYYKEYRELKTQLQDAQVQLISHPKPHPLIYKIATAQSNIDKESYDHYLAEYRTHRTKQSKALAFNDLYKKLQVELPLTTKFIKDHGHLVVTKEAIVDDIFLLKLDHFLHKITQQTKGSVHLLSDLQILKKNIEKQTAATIAYKTWYFKSLSVNDTQKAALNAWLNDLINIGKGYGKNTERNKASAIANMQVAKGAVPIWIMKQETAITFFPDASPQQFDLLIIDEASQCDISSLNLVFRCKKTLIVGDENQTSVVADKNLFRIEKTNELLDKYLYTHKFKTQFDVNNKNNSIYTISGVIYPNIVTLTEHFRCLPEIIGYSNKYVYHSDIVPLKTGTQQLFGPPIALHYIADDPLEEQKPLIVQKVIESIEQLIIRYENKELETLPSIGILTLDSANVKHQHLLRKEITQSTLIKEYEDELQLLIGTSREFQGDERDIMFLTITASHTIVQHNDRTEIKPPRAATTEENMRIFNVAASRAKEKSVVLHSIHPEAVALMNPDCYRKKLIDYYANIQNTELKSSPKKTLESLLLQVDAHSGALGKSVCTLLYQHGFGEVLTPQFKIGKYVVDFAIITNNKKLAIECDGFGNHIGSEKIQEDIKRQHILERAGWRFFRIQSTDWFYRNQQASSELLNWIETHAGKEDR